MIQTCPNYLQREVNPFPSIIQPGGCIRQGVCMIYLILAVAFMIATGIVLANYELNKTQRTAP